MRTYVVTGGAGFIGSNYIHYMFKKYGDEIRIINVDKLTYAGNLENLKDVENRDNYTFIKADVCDAEAINKIFEENDVQRVVHFAAESHVDRSIKNPTVFVETNVLGTLVMLNAAKAAWELPDGTFKPDHKFLHVSTDEVYGTLAPGDKPFAETNKYLPNSPYSASKASSDHLVRAFHRTYGLDVTISNCSNNYGYFHNPEKLIPLTLTNILRGKTIPVYGDGAQIRDWLFVMDHCRGIDLILKKGKVGESYNIGGINEWKNIDIVNLICKTLDDIFDKEPSYREEYPESVFAKGGKAEDLIKHVTDRLGHDRRYAIDPTKMDNELGFRPATKFEDGIRMTIEWYLKHHKWWKKLVK